MNGGRHLNIFHKKEERVCQRKNVVCTLSEKQSALGIYMNTAGMIDDNGNLNSVGIARRFKSFIAAYSV